MVDIKSLENEIAYVFSRSHGDMLKGMAMWHRVRIGIESGELKKLDVDNRDLAKMLHKYIMMSNKTTKVYLNGAEFADEAPTAPSSHDKGLNQGSYSSRKSSPNKKDGCFIATACYGSTEVYQIHLLQRYRDEHLRDTTLGRLFISIYYWLSPSIANYIKNSEMLKKTVRKCLIEPTVNLIKKRL